MAEVEGDKLIISEFCIIRLSDIIIIIDGKNTKIITKIRVRMSLIKYSPNTLA